MIDEENSYVHLTGICKAIGQMRVSTAEIVRLVEALPELSPHIRKVRGGFLKIQGTWVAFELAYQLASRIAWKIRHDLIPIFGPQFPTQCLAPHDPGFGELTLTCSRRNRRGPAPQTSCFGPPSPVIWNDEHALTVGSRESQCTDVLKRDQSQHSSKVMANPAKRAKIGPDRNRTIIVAEKGSQNAQSVVRISRRGNTERQAIVSRKSFAEEQRDDVNHQVPFSEPVYLKPASMTPVFFSIGAQKPAHEHIAGQKTFFFARPSASTKKTKI